MNKVTLTINSLDLAYTIDTYGMFNGDSVDESEADYYREEYQLTDDEAQQIDFDYNHAGIVADLAGSSVAIIERELHGVTPVVVIGCPVIKKSTSPQFYNYTTDSYTADWTIDLDQLLVFANQNQAEFDKHIQDNWNEFVNVPAVITEEYLRADDDKLLVAMFDLYLRSVVDVESYEMAMFESESEAYYENMTPTPEFQKLIDRKRDEIDAEADRIKNQTNLELEA